jgi:hypothetical protein
VKKEPNKNQKEEIILRQITDHLYQSLCRIEDNIEYIVFLRRNNKIQDVSQRFYIQQLDRFSRDTIITFDHILDKDRKGNTLHSLIVRIKEKKVRKKMEVKLDKLRKSAEIIILHRNKVIAHHETDYNSQLGSWYPTQPFNHAYILNPCRCARISQQTEKLFWRLKSELDIDGVGAFVFGGKDAKDVFKPSVLGEKKDENKGMVLIHKCRYKDCLLK